MLKPLAPLTAALLMLGAAPSHAAIFSKAAKPAPAVSDAAVAEVRRAIEEQRLIEAGAALDHALVAGVKDPRLVLLGGELHLARGRTNAALASFRAAEADPVTRAAALQGQGISLSMLGQSDKAVAVLQRAVAEDPGAWRAWNALGCEHDRARRWPEAEAAYEKAFAASGGSPVVLNNRGYSRLLQDKRDLAIADLAEALRKRPDLTEARTNLRLALAMGGDYERATAGGAAADRAGLLNNAGLAAGMRGDYAKAEQLLAEAMTIKSDYYARASENLKMIRALAARNPPGAHAVP